MDTFAGTVWGDLGCRGWMTGLHCTARIAAGAEGRLAGRDVLASMKGLRIARKITSLHRILTGLSHRYYLCYNSFQR
jgi:hypothetical protein